MMKPKSPAKSGDGVNFLNQFPKYFLRPYGPPEVLRKDIFERRLNPQNCEWFRRPNYAISEMAQTTMASQQIIQRSELLNKNLIEKIFDKLQPFMAACGNLDGTNTATRATEDDIDEYVHTTTKNQLASQTFKELYETGHAMMTMGIHFLVAQHLLTNKEEYAQNSRHPSNLDADFKRDPNKTNMKQYLKKTMTFDATETITTTQNARRSLLDLIEIEDTVNKSDDETAQSTPRKRPNVDSDNNSDEEDQPPKPKRNKTQQNNSPNKKNKQKQKGKDKTPKKKNSKERYNALEALVDGEEM